MFHEGQEVEVEIAKLSNDNKMYWTWCRAKIANQVNGKWKVIFRDGWFGIYGADHIRSAFHGSHRQVPVESGNSES